MPLESLLSLVEKLRERITANNRELRKNEWLTRYALIDPLLRELGWDTEDPALVIPEYNVGDGSTVDYALLSEGKPVMMVEAKSLGTPLQDALEQGLRYCLIKRTRYLSITDGERWEIYYDTDKAGDPGKKRLVQFDLKNGSVTEACLKALTLWELRVSSQVAPGQTPVVGPTHNQPDSPEPSIPQPTPPSLEWRPLSRLKPPKNLLPVEIQFPDNSSRPVKRHAWGQLLVAVVRWLVNNGHLTESHCPILKTENSGKYAVSSEPFHPGGNEFRSSAEVELPDREGLLHIDAYASRKRNVEVCRTIIERVGQDPAEFKVRLSPPRTQSALS